MALITRPAKTGGNTTYTAENAAGQTKIKAAEVDADLNTVYAEVNGQLNNANIKTSAGISTSKIAQDGGVVNAHISGSAGILGTKLAISATLNNRQTATTAQFSENGGAEKSLGSVSVAVRGGVVRIMPNCIVKVITPSGSISTLTIRYKRDAVTQATRTVSTGTAGENWLVPPHYSEQPAAATYTYEVTAQLGSVGPAGTLVTSSAPGMLEVIEHT